MNKKDVCQIIAITDRSGSMQCIKQDAIGGFNAFIEEQRKLDGEAEVTLVLFDDQYEVVYKDVDLKVVDTLDDKTFIPRGSTGLYDAIGKTIATLKEERAKGNEKVMPQKVIFAIITDGQENASREFQRDTVMDLIKECRDKKWEFVYLCADERGMQDGVQLFGKASSHSFAASAGGTVGAYKCMSRSVSSYRSDSNANDNPAEDTVQSVMSEASITHESGDNEK